MSNETYHPRGVLVDGYRVRKHPAYRAWASMKSRCRDSNQANYGGRGISYDPSWRVFANFAADMGIKPFPAATIERVDNEKGYSKDNCIWADRHRQARNRRIFKNNKSGFKGVIPLKSRGFGARYDDKGVRYDLGSFDTPEEAARRREEFIRLYEAGDPAAANLLNAGQRDPAQKNIHRLRRDSSTGIKGVTRHVDGGYLVRRTVGGERKYLGYVQTLAEAETLVGGLA